MEMIPKVINYCWFGRNPLPPLAMKCIESWKRFLPDYEIKEWNEDNFDVNIILYTKEAYEAKKYAFVSDYARFWILYHYGGLYFDTDVEVIKPMDNIIAKGPFMGCENEYDSLKIKEGAMALGVAPGLGLGVTPGLGLYKEMLDLYATLSYFNPNGTQNIKTVVSYTSELLVKHGMKYTPNIQLVANVWIYPKDFFCPKDYVSGKIELTVNSVAIHHYGESWQPWDHRLEMFCGDCGGLYGAKVWHSNDAYRRVIWQCNRKFSKTQEQCKTPHLTEDTIKEMFLKAYNRLMRQRKQLIEGQMADARHVNEQANELKAQYEDALKQAHEESAQIVEKARKSAQAEYESRMDAADAEAQKIIANAHKSIDLEREKTVQELQSQIAGLAMAATAKVLGDTDQAAQNKLMYEQFLAKTGGLNDTNSK